MYMDESASFLFLFPCFICCQMELDGVGGIRSCYESERRDDGWIIGPADRQLCLPCRERSEDLGYALTTRAKSSI